MSRRRSHTVEDAVIAFPEDRAASLVGVEERTLRRWAGQGLVRPSTVRRISPRNTVRLYNFRDMQALIVVTMLRESISLQHLRRVIERLRIEYENPLTELVFGIYGRELFFQHSDGSWEGGRRPQQTIARVVIPLDEITARIRDAVKRTRTPQETGRTGRERRVLGSKEVFAGTRVPVEAVRAFLAEGRSDKEILQAFPRLTVDDIDAVRERMAV